MLKLLFNTTCRHIDFLNKSSITLRFFNERFIEVEAVTFNMFDYPA